MKKNYVIPAVKVANIVLNQIVMTSGSDPEPGPNPKDDQFLPFDPTPEEEGYAD